MAIKIGINGFGRIGRVIFRTCLQNPDLEISAINDPAVDVEYICYLIKFDSTHGKFNGSIKHDNDEIDVNGNTIKVFHEKLPSNVPWQTAGVQYVVEASGMFTNLEKASGHLASDGVKRVIVTAPSVDVPMIILGVNENKLHPEQKVMSCASSTLYCLAPIVKVLEDNFGVLEGFITSIHAMTPSLKPLDGLCLRGKHWRDHRSIHQNIIPATTGACKALGKIIPQVKDKMSGLAFRVPIVNVSVLDLTLRLKKNTTISDIVKSVKNASRLTMQNIINISNEEAVSSDFIGDSHSCILDVDSSLQLKQDFFKLICWYENEYSYACRVIDSIFFSEKQLKQYESKSKMTYVRPRPMKKQDILQQTDSCKKEASVECCTPETTSKIICSTSQDTGIKVKPPTRPVFLKKPLSSHTSGTIPSFASSRDTKKRNEMFKIWNDSSEIIKPGVRQNRGSFFHSCIAFAPQSTERTDCLKAQERLEDVKKEFSKMVNITEDLLKKSYDRKCKFNTMKEELKDHNKVVTNVKEKPIKTYTIERGHKLRDAAMDVSGDCKMSGCTINSENLNEISKEEVIAYDYCEKDVSHYNIKQDKKAQEETKDKIIKKTNPQVDVKLTDVEEFQNQVVKTVNTLIQGLSQNVYSIAMSNLNTFEKDDENINKIIEKDNNRKDVNLVVNDNENSQHAKLNHTGLNNKENLSPTLDEVKSESTNQLNVNIDVNKEMKNIQVLDEALKKRNILIVNDNKINTQAVLKKSTPECALDPVIETDDYHKDMELRKHILKTLNRFAPDPIVIISDDSSTCQSPQNTNTTSNVNVFRDKQDIYDKLDSISATDSENSFQINERKSQVINITDLTNSLDDLARLDKICRIIEISDELSDKLFSALDRSDNGTTKKEWSFKDLCERIKLDEFCNKVFGKTAA